MITILKLIKKHFAFTIFICIFIFMNIFLILSTTDNEKNITNSFRIHVVGATDSIDDQKIKLEVADNIQKYIHKINQSLNDTSKLSLKNNIIQNIDTILSIANSTIKANGKNYTAIANVGNIYYDKKTYNDTISNEGIYDSIQIVLDSGKGQNWWSLVYPYSYEHSIDSTEISNDISTEDLLNTENYKISFGLLELIFKLCLKTK